MALRELPLLYRTAQRLTLNSSEAEDLVGQTLLLGAKAWHSFDGRYPRSWMIKIMKNEFLSTVRKKAVDTVALEDGLQAGEDGLMDHVTNRAVASEILRELDSIPEEYRIAVALCDVEELSYEEAAAALGVPLGTIRSRLFRGRRILRDRLADFAPACGASTTIGTAS